MGSAGWRVRLVWRAPGVELEGLTDGVCALDEEGLLVGKVPRCHIRTRTIIGGRWCAHIGLREGGARVQHAGHVYPVQVGQTTLRDGGCPLAEGQLVRFFMPGGEDLVPAFDLRLERGPAPPPTPRRRAEPRTPPSDTPAPARVTRLYRPAYGRKLLLRVEDVHPAVFDRGGPAPGSTYPLSAGIGDDYDRCRVLVPSTPSGSLGRRIYRVEGRRGGLLLHSEPPRGAARVAGASVQSFPCIIGPNQPIELLFENSSEAAITLVVTERDE